MRPDPFISVRVLRFAAGLPLLSGTVFRFAARPFPSCPRRLLFRSCDDLQTVVEGEFLGLRSLRQAVVLALVGDVGSVAAVLDEHVGILGKTLQRRVGRGRGRLVCADDLNGAVVADRVGVVGTMVLPPL